MAKSKVVVEVSLAWWFVWLYLPMCIFVRNFIVNYVDVDFELDEEKIEFWLKRAVRVGH